mmetsp:Transcript_6171/g.10769  ORF Transcript_6171/g.10769 Transcript_6171/m.10769 type:complete len:233 (+) Transcript_6171:2-700(+)
MNTLVFRRNEEGYEIEALNFKDEIFVPPILLLKPCTIPSCAAWFSPTNVHQIEIDSLPEFFNGKYSSKTPQTYISYRNYIIALYRKRPESNLPASMCWRSLPGDVCSVIRLHAFLEHWGLINFQTTQVYPKELQTYQINSPVKLEEEAEEPARLTEEDFSRAVERASELYIEEDSQLLVYVHKILTAQIRKVELKAKYIADMECILKLQETHCVNQLQQIATQYASLANIKN